MDKIHERAMQEVTEQMPPIRRMKTTLLITVESDHISGDSWRDWVKQMIGPNFTVSVEDVTEVDNGQER